MDEDPKTYQLPKPGRIFVVGWAILILVVVGLTTALVTLHAHRLNAEAGALGREIEKGPRVLVIRVKQAPRTRSLELPGTVRGFVETSVYAKVSGYLRTMKVDKGDRIKRGQLLATLESPELDHEVANARAAYQLAKLTDERNQSLLHEGVIARQSADESEARVKETAATLQQLVAMNDYKAIRAPFDGVVTARLIDPGALIPQSTAPAAANVPLLQLATLSPLRIYADVPQSLALFVRDGDPATITVTEYPGRIFEGSVTRHPEALANATRTMLVEVDMPNDDHALLPGMYARMGLRVSAPEGPPQVPDDALIFRDGKPFVPLVRNDHLKLAAVALGYDDGVNVQITKGVETGDMVAINVGQAAHDGAPVRPMTAQENH
jgi:membrane fusion protein (multidrug efflux system)